MYSMMPSRQRDVSFRTLFCCVFISLLSISTCTPDTAESEPVASVVKAEVSDEPSTASTENQDIRLSSDGSDRSRSTTRDLYGSDYPPGSSQLYSSNRQGYNPASQAQLENTRMLPSQSLIGYPTVMGPGYPNAYPGAYPHLAPHGLNGVNGLYPPVSPYQSHLYPAGIGGLGHLMGGLGLGGLGVQPYQYGPQINPALYGHGSPIASPFLPGGISPFHNQLYPGALEYGYGHRLPHAGYYPTPYAAHHPYIDPYRSYPGQYHTHGHVPSPYYGTTPHNLYQPSLHSNLNQHHGNHYGNHLDGRHQGHSYTGRGYSPRDSYRGTSGLEYGRGGFSNNHEMVTPYINQRGGYYPDTVNQANRNLNTQSTVESPTLAVAPATQQAVNNVPPVSPVPAVQRFPYGYRQRRLRTQNQLQTHGASTEKNLEGKLHEGAKINQASNGYSPIINPHLLQAANRYANQPGVRQDNRSIRRTLNRLYNTEQIPYQTPTKPSNANEQNP